MGALLLALLPLAWRRVAKTRHPRCQKPAMIAGFLPGHLKNKCKGPHHGINKYPVAPASPFPRAGTCRRGNPVLTPGPDGVSRRLPNEPTATRQRRDGIVQPAPWPGGIGANPHLTPVSGGQGR